MRHPSISAKARDPQNQNTTVDGEWSIAINPRHQDTTMSDDANTKPPIPKKSKRPHRATCVKFPTAYSDYALRMFHERWMYGTEDIQKVHTALQEAIAACKYLAIEEGSHQTIYRAPWGVLLVVSEEGIVKTVLPPTVEWRSAET